MEPLTSPQRNHDNADDHEYENTDSPPNRSTDPPSTEDEAGRTEGSNGRDADHHIMQQFADHAPRDTGERDPRRRNPRMGAEGVADTPRTAEGSQPGND